MKRVHVSRDIVPMAEFKVHASRYLRHMHEGRRPLIITQNGKPAAVVVTPEEFDRLCEEREFLASVRQGLADADAGRLIDDEALERRLDAEFGPLDRS